MEYLKINTIQQELKRQYEENGKRSYIHVQKHINYADQQYHQPKPCKDL